MNDQHSGNSDYERIARAIAFISSHADRQPRLEEIAAHVGLSPFHFQRLFSRWAGVTPKRFLQVLTVERAKQLLQEPRPLLEVAESAGLSSGSRLYDHFVQLEAVTPGEYRRGGQDMTLEYAVQETPFGDVFIAATQRGVNRITFLDGDTPEQPLAELREQWPSAHLCENRTRMRDLVSTIFNSTIQADRPLSLHVAGTNFQVSVWKALLCIPPGKVASYGELAAALQRPKAARAVGAAVGANPVAFLIPCHRVISQSGLIGGYHWGKERKHAMHAWEAARYE